jgi:hypothetical protein
MLICEGDGHDTHACFLEDKIIEGVDVECKGLKGVVFQGEPRMGLEPTTC